MSRVIADQVLCNLKISTNLRSIRKLEEVAALFKQ